MIELTYLAVIVNFLIPRSGFQTFGAKSLHQELASDSSFNLRASNE